jgi:hypothetical protein
LDDDVVLNVELIVVIHDVDVNALFARRFTILIRRLLALSVRISCLPLGRISLLIHAFLSRGHDSLHLNQLLLLRRVHNLRWAPTTFLWRFHVAMELFCRARRLWLHLNIWRSLFFTTRI